MFIDGYRSLDCSAVCCFVLLLLWWCCLYRRRCRHCHCCCCWLQYVLVSVLFARLSFWCCVYLCVSVYIPLCQCVHRLTRFTLLHFMLLFNVFLPFAIVRSLDFIFVAVYTAFALLCFGQVTFAHTHAHTSTDVDCFVGWCVARCSLRWMFPTQTPHVYALLINNAKFMNAHTHSLTHLSRSCEKSHRNKTKQNQATTK